MNPLVSVIIPTYNRAELVIGAMESVWMQTYRPIELIVVDDGSTDKTRERVSQWAKKHIEPPIFEVRYLYQENRGANAARNLGIRESRGEFIAFLDSDDRWLPEKLEKQVPLLLSDPNIGGVYCGLQYIDLATGELQPFSPRPYPQGDILRELLVRDVTEGEPCWVVKKSCLEDVGLFDENLPARLGWDLWIRLASKYKIAAVPEVLVYGGHHGGERVRTNPMNEIIAYEYILHKYVELRRTQPWWLEYQARAAYYRRKGRVLFHRVGSPIKAILMYVLAILHWPFCFDSYAALIGVVLPKRFRESLHLTWNKVFGKTFLAIRSF